ncbi:MAG: hypothetical protein CFH34_00620 [Alphaproteobacteria bacterium MarineAlpha9_Bin4]|nr:MAG: hypothetical protein CFH34_00620 [Alphaproteobacteria bacterium MarineAlpha9_Bin4]|tara:strand:+ start:61 stop:753 length:693 start_codon:yes stop_codon:yes gene_type:complete
MKKIFIIVLFFIFRFEMAQAELTHNDILKEAHNFLASKNQNLILSINKKVKIPSCFGEIKINDKYNNLKTLEILCLGNTPWKYNLRTNISQNLKKTKRKKLKKKKIGVMVSLKKLKRGYILQAEDFKLKYFSQIGSNNVYSDAEKLIGRKLKASLKENQIIRERHLVKNWLIKEGQKVKIEHKRGNLRIIVDGIALDSGMLGDYLKVKNENSGKVVKGWVKNNKKITIFR